MTARRENAGVVQASAARSSSGSSRAAGAAGTGRRSGGLAGGLLGRSAGSRSPGDTAVMMALAFAVAAAALSVYAALDSNAVPVDHEGEPLGTFAAIERQTYSLLSGEPPVTETTSYIDAAGPVIVVFILLPVLVAAGTFISHRRRVQSRPLTFGLVGMALVSVVNPFSLYFLPSLIALAVAGFQVRKAEMPERMAAARGDEADEDDEDDDEVIDVDEVEPEDELDEDEYDDEVEDTDEELADDEVEDDEEYDEVEDDEVRAEDAGEADAEPERKPEQDDVLAELEAEIEAEDEPDAGGGRRRGRGFGGRSSGR